MRYLAWLKAYADRAGHYGFRQDEILTNAAPLEDSIEDWRKSLRQLEKPETIDRIRRMTDKGFLCGDSQFIKQIERRLRRRLKPRPRGRPKE